MKQNLPYFESDAEVAEYLGMSIQEFLTARNTGKLGVTPRPKDPEKVYWRCDVDKWRANGKPCAWNTPDPSGVSRKPLEQEVTPCLKTK